MIDPYLLTEAKSGIADEGGRYIKADAATSNFDIQYFDFSVNMLKAILWQYQNAPNLQGIISNENEWYNESQTQFWTDWIANVFNLATANEFGLSVWAIILGFPNFINTGSNENEPIFGFDGSGGVNFDNGILGSSGETVVLPIETQRLGLQFRYFQLCSSGTIPEINRFLAYLFGGPNKAWLVSNGDMTQTYLFNFPVPWNLAYLFNNFDILPRPAGVGSSWVDLTLTYFGFDIHPNFDNATLQ